MAKSVHNDVLDAALNIIKNNATQISITVNEPTTYGTATGTYALAIKSDLTSGSFTGPADDAASPYGRKLTVAEVAAQEVLVTGDAGFVALCDVDDRLLYVTSCTVQTLTDGNTVTIPAWKIQIGDPT